MPATSIIFWSITAFLGLAGAFNLFAPRALRERTANWNYPADLARGGGVVELLAATFLGLPELRLIGLVFAGFAFFTAGVTFMERHRYLAAAIGVALMLALIPTALAIRRAI